jgi:hypothetical protein
MRDMAAGFSFGFAGDDIDNNEAADLDGAPSSEHSAAMQIISLPARRHSVEDLVSFAVIVILA